jgi:hypothetical protein
MTDEQALERGQRRLVPAPYHNQDIIEARGRNLPDGPADKRLAVERQEELWRTHSRRSACC